jgi:hypothetical protein
VSECEPKSVLDISDIELWGAYIFTQKPNSLFETIIALLTQSSFGSDNWVPPISVPTNDDCLHKITLRGMSD